MVTGFKTSSGVDLDTIFAARVSAAGANCGFKNSAGVDLAQLFEPGSAGVHPTDTGFRNSAGTDLRLLFSTVAAAPTSFTGAFASRSKTSGTATVTGTIKADGTIVFTNDVGGSAGPTKSWLVPNLAGGGALYDVKIARGAITPAASGSASGMVDGTWYQCNADRTFSLSSGQPICSQTWTLTWRRRSDLVTVCTGTGSFECDVS